MASGKVDNKTKHCVKDLMPRFTAACDAIKKGVQRVDQNKKIKLLVIDEEMNTVELILTEKQVKEIDIPREHIKSHKSKTALNKEIAAFVEKNIPEQVV